MSGTACSGSGCPGQYEVINFNNLGDLNGYTIQTGDKLVVRQYDPSGLLAGAGFCFTDGSCQVSYAGVNDQDGYWAVEDGVVGSWHYRRINLSPMAGKVINNAYVDVHPNTSSGTWHMYFQDMALVSANGTVYLLLTRQNTVSMWAHGAGQTNLTYSPTISTATADVTKAAQTTYYYHGDQIGSSRLMTSGGGWPVWQGTFLPYGEEYNAQIGVNHYEFTGKERDDESGLDYFGARYYGNAMGRFTSADPKRVTLRHLLNPQKLNQYAYGLNNPLRFIDPTGGDVTLGTCKDTGSNFTEYDYFGGNVLAEQNQAGHSRDYIYAGGKRIAKADVLDTRLGVSAMSCSNCTEPYVVFNFNNIGDLKGHTIQAGDKLFVRQLVFSGQSGEAGGEEYNAQMGTNHYKFTGKERDDESGLDLMGARHFGNAFRHFTRPNPNDRPKAKDSDPQQWKMYSYARNSGINKAKLYGNLRKWKRRKGGAQCGSSVFNKL